MSTMCNCHGMIYPDCPNYRATRTPRLFTEAEVRELVRKAREDEREACAKIVDNGADAKINVPVVARKALAAAIRARGGKTK